MEQGSFGERSAHLRKNHGESHAGELIPEASLNDQPAAREECHVGAETARSRTAKKQYSKPSFRYERVFETMALSCGKKSPVEFQCRFNRRSS